jgi:hypothetical protein
MQLTLKVLKFEILNFKTLNSFSFYVLFNISIAQHVSAYLAIIRRIKIAGGIAALLYTVVTRVDASSQFLKFTFKIRNLYNRLAYFCGDLCVSFSYVMCRYYCFIIVS